MTLFASKKVTWLLIIAAFAAAYLFNISGWLMHDDEGTDFYEVWQLQEGQQPGVDYVAEQQPLYLISGSFLVGLGGRTALLLRVLSFAQVMAGTLILTFVVRRIFGDRIAVISMGLILTPGLVFEQSRLFRPDPMMLAWEMIGLAAVLWAVHKQHRIVWAIAGASYGVAFLWKPFAVFPIVGLGFYFLYWLWQGRSQENKFEPIISGLYFGAAFLLVSVGLSFFLYSQLGFYYGEIFNQHAQLGADLTVVDLVSRVFLFYFLLFWVNGAYLLLFPLWFVNRKIGTQHPALIKLFVFQLISPVVFIGISRPMYLRYYIYLIPVIAILLARQLDLSLGNLGREHKRFERFVPIVVGAIFIVAIVVTRPNIPELLFQKESDTIALAEYISANTEANDIVLSDYAGLNYFSDRRSIPEASIIAGGRITGGIITSRLLIDRIEEYDVQMVLIHVEGGYPPPHQFVELDDYEGFRSYINEHFVLSTVFDRAGQQIEVYQRN